MAVSHLLTALAILVPFSVAIFFVACLAVGALIEPAVNITTRKVLTDKEQFIEWMADFTMSKMKITRDEAVTECRNALSEFCRFERAGFGHKDYDWSKSGAHEIAQEMIVNYAEGSTQ